MQVNIDLPALEKLGRLVAIQLSHYTLRCVAIWRRYVEDYDEAMIIVAITSISADRLTRAELDPNTMDLANPLPRNLLSRCNVSSIAAATGINRETARRKIGRLIGRGILVRDKRGNIDFAAGLAQEQWIGKLIYQQLEASRRFTEEQLRNGVLKWG
jgi:hypothetical protein